MPRDGSTFQSQDLHPMPGKEALKMNCRQRKPMKLKILQTDTRASSMPQTLYMDPATMDPSPSGLRTAKSSYK